MPAAGIDAPAAGIWWVAVESPPGRAGPYRIRLWVSDVTPPRIRVLGQAVVDGRRVLRLRVVDSGSGVNPGGITVSGGGLEHRTVDFDAATGIATIDLNRLEPGQALAARAGARPRRDQGRAVRLGGCRATRRPAPCRSSSLAT